MQTRLLEREGRVAHHSDQLLRESAAARCNRKKGVKPHLRKAASGRWECSDGEFARAGSTPKDAYDRWLLAALIDAQERVRLDDPLAMPSPRKRAKVKQAAPGVRVHRIEEQETPHESEGKGEGVLPAKKKRSKPVPYVGTVAVSRAAPSRDGVYRLPDELRRAGIRAAAAQPPLLSISDGNHRAGPAHV